MTAKAKDVSEAHTEQIQDETNTEKAASHPPEAIPTTHDAEGQPSPWGQGHIQLYMACALIYLCSTMNGYDGSLLGSLNVLPEYQEYYGLGDSGSTSTGLVFSIFQIGQMAGALFTWICDWKGRKITLAATSFLVCASAVFTAVAPTLSSFIVARFLLSFFSTINTVAAPMLLVEIAPPLQRATVAGAYNSLYYIGSIIATFTMYGANTHLSGNIKWRLPLWLQMLCPGLVCLGSWMLPESPRWQVAQERSEEARNFIIKYHANGDAGHPIVAIEMKEIQDSLVELQGRSKWACFDLRSLYRSRARRYRIMLVIAMSWFGQFSGNNVSSYYLPMMVKNVGTTSTNMVLLLNAFYALTGWIAATIGGMFTSTTMPLLLLTIMGEARLHDVVGRRKMLMGSCLGMSIALAIVAATAAEYERSGSVPSSSASIAFIFIFGVVFAVGFTPMQPIYPAEVLANDMRANGMMIFQMTSGCAGFVNTFAAPVAMNKIRYWLSHAELADIHAKAQKVIDTLFPSSSLEELSSMTRQQLSIRLQSSTDSPSVVAAEPHDSLQVLEPSLEQNFTWEEVSDNESETSRVADDVNGLAFSRQSPNASYLGLSSVPTILQVIAHLCPHVQRQVPPGPQAWRSPSTLGASPGGTTFSKEEEIPLINAYFNHVHPIIPMVDEADFRQQYAKTETAEDEATPWLALLNMVLAMGSMASDSTHFSSHNFFYKRALPYLNMSSFGSGHLYMVQALALYSGMILHFLNKPNMAMAVMGATIRMAVAMGLHRAQVTRSNANDAYHPVTGSTITRIRTWWSLLCLDTWASSTLGRPSLGYWNRTTILTTSMSNLDSLDYETISLAASEQFCRIATRIQERLIRLPLTSQDEVSELDRELLAWKGSLHMILAHREQCPPTLNIARAVLWWRYITTRLTLYRPSLLITALGRKPWSS
ncbi:hypothetical protein NW762_012804 [Fusarium torreyae]|uniref:Major facilitator superfamily (MFS) profile domain-containing protein n=1 Tax=Fusarium torreyae TaxID=1237075 RepID=A0A9W8RM05_9HYPO|nr:hypothetical protein NW762_012804 [Fusarium torreyae]